MIYLSIFLSLFFILFVLIKQSSQPAIEKIVKIVASTFFTFYILHQIGLQWGQYQQAPYRFTFFSWLNWGLVILLFVFFLVSYLIREAPKVRASKLSEVVIPLICSVLPFVIVESPRWANLKMLRSYDLIQKILKPFYIQAPAHWNPLSILFIIVGGVLTVAAMVTLKKSFSIFTEVRTPVYSGVYKYLRHPMYVGEVLSTAGICFLTPSYLNVFVVILFAILLYFRSQLEESKISQACPDYQGYKNNTGLFFFLKGRGLRK